MDGVRIEKGTGGGTPRRRIMEAFKLRELSAVDRPAQQHAKMTLMKRDSSESENATKKGTDMTQEEMQKKLDAEVAKSAELTTKLEKAEADLAALKAKEYEMDEEEAAAAALMDEKSKKSFEAMSKADRKAHLAELRKNDEVLKVEGVGEIRKSLVGETQFAVFKAQQTRIEKAEAEAAKQAELAKRADLRKSIETGVLKNLPGEVDAVVDAMKAIGDLDPTIGKTINTMLEAGAKAIGAAYTSLGHAGEAKKAAGDFLKKVDEIKTAEKCSHQDAMVKARKDHPELFAAYQSGGAKGN